MKTRIDEYIIRNYNFVNFSSGSMVLDIGCGHGEQLEKLRVVNCIGVGIDISRNFSKVCKKKGSSFIQGAVEYLPFKDATFSGAICKVVLPYTDEEKAVSEISRVVKKGGRVIVCGHGLGFYLNQSVFLRDWKGKIYSLLTIINTCIYILFRRRWRSSIYQSKSRMKKYFNEFNLKVEKETLSDQFLGYPVFIYHEALKV